MSIEYLNLGKLKLDEVNRLNQSADSLNRGDSVENAYAIQSDICQLRVERGDRIIGFKVGCISETIQRSLGIHHPIFGRLFASECWKSPSTLPLDQFDGLAIEGELAVKLSRPLADVKNKTAEPIDVIDAVFPVIELHNYSFAEAPAAADLIARNAIHAGFLHGEIDQKCIRFPQYLSISIDDKEVAKVAGQDLFETVNQTIQWLSSEFHRRQIHLVKDQIILCGSVAPLIPLPHGGRVSVSTDISEDIECEVRSL